MKQTMQLFENYIQITDIIEWSETLVYLYYYWQNKYNSCRKNVITTSNFSIDLSEQVSLDLLHFW